jgi:uncharacterized protein YegJ (DUF2314 family)
LEILKIFMKSLKRIIFTILGAVALLTSISFSLLALLHPLMGNRVFHWHFLLGLPIYFVMFRYGKKWLLNEIDLNIFPVKSDDPIMQKAISEAREKIPYFLDTLKQQKYQCYIKFPMKYADRRIEHIWAIAHAVENNEVISTLANDPVYSHVIESERLRIPVAEIEDWQIHKNEEEWQGGFTSLATAQILRKEGYSIMAKDKKVLKKLAKCSST